jgi:hypothetical protein
MNEAAETALSELEQLLTQLNTSRREPDRFAQISEAVLAKLEHATGLVDADHPELTKLNKLLVSEFLFAARSAELRSPLSVANLSKYDQPKTSSSKY